MAESRVMRHGLQLFVLALVLQGCGGGSDDGGNPAPSDTTPPTVPAGLTATAQSATAIQLAWQASTDSGSGVSGYRIYRDGGATAIATVTGTSHLDTGLLADTSYTYAVRAFDGASPANVSAPSGGAGARTLPGTPTSGSGIDTRPANASCLAGDAPSTGLSLGVERVFAGLPTFTRPLLMIQAPGNNSAWYVAEQGGLVYTFANQANVTTRRVFIDVRGTMSNPENEMGLLGMAFHPGYPANPRAYLSYSALDAGRLVTRVVEYQTRDSGQTLDPASAQVVIQVYQPITVHGGGNIAFGPDGYLYIGRGDGALPLNPQSLRNLLGKMLRIDVNGTTGTNRYAIPAGNPFAGNPLCNNDVGTFTTSCPEIYAYGFRNPWRWSFDRATGDLWLADVGEADWEEVNRVVSGGNYGWNCRQGAHSNAACTAPGAIDPVAEYDHSVGASITGGYVYRGSAIPSLVGRYVFADFATGRLWHIASDAAPTVRVTTGLDTGLSVSSFGQDQAGELYLVDYGGSLHRLTNTAGGGRVIPSELSATGCVNPADPTQVASGLIPYAPSAPFWSDGATKIRHLALPDGQQITVDSSGDFVFPNGSVLMKSFRLGGRLVETRLFMRHNNGTWAGYTYEWNTQGTEALRVVGGKSVTVEGQSWRFPSEAQCLQCHTNAAGNTLGLEIAQLNAQFGYPNGRLANQLTTLDHIGLLNPALSQPPAQLPGMPDPAGTTGTLAERARAYLHTNCAGCHRPGGPTNVNLDLRYTTPLANTFACEVVPVRNLGVANARIIAVGGTDPASRSLLALRPQRTDADAMPPLLPRTVDTAGTTLLRNWINSLGSCN